MAKRTIYRLIDDLSGGDADETVRFGLDGKDFEIDLTESHAAQLREAMAPFVTAGTRVGGRTQRTGRIPAPRIDPEPNKLISALAAPIVEAATNGYKRTELPTVPDNKKVREWAADKGIAVSDRGRIKQTIVDRYIAEHAAGSPNGKSKAAKYLPAGTNAKF